jgi:endonuclease/exonuclease/phosphatase (EEP) superfamily protein YafD
MDASGAAQATTSARRDPGATDRRRLRILWAAALLWVGGLLLLLALFRFVGESAWPVVLLLYLPRHPWLLPGLILVPFAVRRGRRALLWPLGLGALLWLFPLMNFALPQPLHRPEGPTLRVLSYNTTHAADGVEGLRGVLAEARPDVVLFQWTSHLVDEALAGPGFEGWTVRRTGQFTVASRFPIRDLEAVGGTPRGEPPCAHAVLESPLGPLDVYTIRPRSARDELGASHHRSLPERLRDLVHRIRTGQMPDMAAYREAQLRSIAEAVARARYPVVIAGDSNVPDGSLLLRTYLGGYRDAFSGVGWGFGYTHPARLPWMRLDRVLLGPGLAPVAFEVLGRRLSAHRAVVAEIARAPAG